MKKAIIQYLTVGVLLLSGGWLIASPGWEPIVMLMYALTTYLIEDRRKARIPKVDGRWEYAVVSASNRFSHKGECTITAEGTTLRIDGIRRYSCMSLGDRFVCAEVNTKWRSEWAQVCDDNLIRFIYSIALPDPLSGDRYIRGMCSLSYTSNQPTQLEGDFHVVPPFEKDAMFCNWGSLVLRRLGTDSTVTPPKEYDPAQTSHSPGGQNSNAVIPAYHGDQAQLPLK